MQVNSLRLKYNVTSKWTSKTFGDTIYFVVDCTKDSDQAII